MPIRVTPNQCASSVGPELASRTFLYSLQVITTATPSEPGVTLCPAPELEMLHVDNLMEDLTTLYFMFWKLLFYYHAVTALIDN